MHGYAKSTTCIQEFQVIWYYHKCSNNAERDGKLVKTGWTNARCKDMM